MEPFPNVVRISVHAIVFLQETIGCLDGKL